VRLQRLGRVTDDQPFVAAHLQDLAQRPHHPVARPLAERRSGREQAANVGGGERLHTQLAQNGGDPLHLHFVVLDGARSDTAVTGV
jgi:hypothetical protein